MSIAQLVEEINSLPPYLREQALDFIAFQKSRAQKQLLLQEIQPNTVGESANAPDDLNKAIGGI